MTDQELINAFNNDPGIPYCLSAEDCQRLLALVGEYEPIVDAILWHGGASDETRAEELGISVNLFRECNS